MGGEANNLPSEATTVTPMQCQKCASRGARTPKMKVSRVREK